MVALSAQRRRTGHVHPLFKRHLRLLHRGGPSAARRAARGDASTAPVISRTPGRGPRRWRVGVPVPFSRPARSSPRTRASRSAPVSHSMIQSPTCARAVRVGDAGQRRRQPLARGGVELARRQTGQQGPALLDALRPALLDALRPSPARCPAPAIAAATGSHRSSSVILASSTVETVGGASRGARRRINRSSHFANNQVETLLARRPPPAFQRQPATRCRSSIDRLCSSAATRRHQVALGSIVAPYAPLVNNDVALRRLIRGQRGPDRRESARPPRAPARHGAAPL